MRKRVTYKFLFQRRCVFTTEVNSSWAIMKNQNLPHHLKNVLRNVLRNTTVPPGLTTPYVGCAILKSCRVNYMKHPSHPKLNATLKIMKIASQSQDPSTVSVSNSHQAMPQLQCTVNYLERRTLVFFLSFWILRDSSEYDSFTPMKQIIGFKNLPYCTIICFQYGN